MDTYFCAWYAKFPAQFSTRFTQAEIMTHGADFNTKEGKMKVQRYQ